MKRLFFIVSSFVFCFSIYGEEPTNLSAPSGSGADALFQSAGGVIEQKPSTQKLKTGVSKTVDSSVDLKELKLDNPFVLKVYSDIASDPETGFDLKVWSKFLGQQEYEKAAHLYSTLSSKVGDRYKSYLNVTQIYLYYKLNLHQSFLLQYVQHKELASHQGLLSLLEQTLDNSNFEQWLSKSELTLSSQQSAQVSEWNIKGSKLVLFLKAKAAYKNAKLAKPLLSELSSLGLGSHLFSRLGYELAKTVSLNEAVNGDLKSSAKTLKTFVEPYLESQKNEALTSQHQMTIARLLYQAGSLEGAEQFYLKVPRKSEQFLTAQEELMWVYLRLGKLEQLRGSLITLSLNAFENRFQPEVYVVRAISNLKLCYYADVLKDFELFISRNTVFSKEIDQVLSMSHVQRPKELDQWMVKIEKSIDDMKKEKARLDVLSERSISAVLPAVGVQSHWTESKKSLDKQLEFAQKTLESEYRRAWLSKRNSLLESIKKMQFVRVELLSQLAMTTVAGEQGTNSDNKKDQNAIKANFKAEEAKSQIYPFDGVVWSDELFKLKSFTKGKCLGQ